MTIQQVLLGIAPGGIPFNVPTWSTVDTGWTASNNNYDGDYAVASAAYAHIITGALTDGTTYRFYLDRKSANFVGYGGWFFADTTNPSNGVPNEIGGNSVGRRMHYSAYSNLGVWGTYATANSATAGNGIDSGGITMADVANANDIKIEFVIDRTVDKVWMREHDATSWIGGGDPEDTSSTASFSIPDGGTVYFGCVEYGTGGEAYLTDS